MEALRKFIRDLDGATAIEYALVGALTAIIAIAGVNAAGESIFDMFLFVADRIVTAIGL